VIATAVVLTRLGLALAFGAAIGVEREWRQKQAGLKTMVLVALGAATFAMLSNTFGSLNHNPGQLAAAVVGGIGFLGAGVIMHRGFTVQGVTTAATLWVTASVGVAAGLGQYPAAGILTAGVVIVQFVMRPFENAILRARRVAVPGRVELRTDCEGESLPLINAALRRHPDLEPVRRTINRGVEHLTLRVILRVPAGSDLTPIEEALIAIEGVHAVDLRHLGIEEE
jgi:putative Mg2+ transporter-C (MgtC) family protein